MKEYLITILLSLDQLLNAILGRDEDMSMSGRAYIREAEGGSVWQRKAIDTMFFWQDEHCKSAFQAEYDKRVEFIEKYKSISE